MISFVDTGYFHKGGQSTLCGMTSFLKKDISRNKVVVAWEISCIRFIRVW